MNLRYGAAAVAVVFVGSVTAAQQPPFRSGANYVRVDVYPTANGKPVDDLTATNFQILEDGKRQTIDSFEHVSARTRENGSDALTADVRNRRSFVLFLDTANVSSAASLNVAEPLIGFLDRLVGDGDVIAVMTPDMSTGLLQFGSKTDVVVRALRDHPKWGRRDDRTMFDETEQRYIACYPMLPIETAKGRTLSELAQNMIDRRRERRTLDALNDLVTFSGSLGDTRKTIVAVTEGWRLFGTDQQMLEPRRLDPDKPQTEDPPGPPGISVGRDGKLTTGDPSSLRSLRYPCEADRLRFASLDDTQYLRDIIGNANRRNTSFYTIDPRGLAVFDASIQWDRPVGEALPLRHDGANLNSSHSSMRMLAVDTDGVAVLDSNDLSGGLNRIAQDLSSYYLLGYYSTNARTDGKFREISVRVTRPGVQVRARRGYRAPTAAELASAAPPAAAVDPARLAIAAALVDLDSQVQRNAVAIGPVRVFRRGPLTGNELVPAASMMFSRTDRLHLERAIDAGVADDATARILDRNGQGLPIPLTPVVRTDEEGRRWLTTDVSLAPLAAGDYVIEIVATGEKTFTAIRIGR